MTNRLAHEKSPYLLQHADNPVDWYPWGDAAFDKARAEDKPVLLSVGYSTCHWCHVMAHESFESHEIAAVLNEYFVSIKVDREERPDVDSVYMAAVQAMTGQGGWPMTVFMTPAADPFFAGTYFPPEDRYGRPGFPRLLQGVMEAWQSRRADIESQGRRLMESVAGMKSATAEDGPLPYEAFEQCVADLAAGFDTRYGGFGSAPKFPRPMAYGLLLRHHARTGDDRARDMVVKTLDVMADGGIYDHLGGGFARYSTDAQWLVPHFEKMLYDNAQLVRSYLELQQVTGEARWGDVARDILEYVLRELTSPQGGFYCAEDADSEGREGAFYVWTPEALAQAAGEDADLAAHRYGVTQAGNFEHGGESVLWLAKTTAEVAKHAGLTEDQVRARLERVREKLFAARDTRPRPGLDDKVLTAWNGLMIGAMAYAYRVLGDPRYLQAATRAVDFVNSRLTAEDGGLLRRWRDGEARFTAYLDDHVMLADGLLDLYEVTFDGAYLARAAELMMRAIDRFCDHEHGGFFYTAQGQDKHLKARLKDAYDGAIPSGNSVAVSVLLRLAAITGDALFRTSAQQTLGVFAKQLKAAPQAFPLMLSGLADSARPPHQIVIAGPRDDPRTQALLQVVYRRYLPGAVLVLAEPGVSDLPKAALDRPMVDGRATAYVCRDFTCTLPITDPKALDAELLP